MTKILVWKLDTTPTTNKIIESIIFKKQLKSLDDVSKNIPQGAYTTFRTFKHDQVIHLQDHFIRLDETARLTNSSVSIDQSLIRVNLRHAVGESGAGDLRVRITMDLEIKPGDIYFSIEKLMTPPLNAFSNGVSVVSVKMQRDNPKAKLTSFLKSSETIRTSHINHFNEALMVDERGIILEGLSSNFFAVYNDQIWTEEEKVLSGITRKIVLEEAQKMGIKINLSGIGLDMTTQIQEAFITSTSRSVLPIREIDKIPIGNGKPGPITRALMENYQSHINTEMEKI